MSIALGATAGLAGAVAVAVLHATGREHLAARIAFWLLLPAGPVAAFDAWGAATERQRPAEARARATIILGLCWGGAAWLLLR